MLNILVVTSDLYWEDFFQSHSSFKDRLTERCGLSMLHLEGAPKKWAAKVCIFFHAGPHCADTTGGGFCKHFGWWQWMVVWVIFWRWHYYPQSLMEIRSLTWCWFHNKFFCWECATAACGELPNLTSIFLSTINYRKFQSFYKACLVYVYLF